MFFFKKKKSVSNVEIMLTCTYVKINTVYNNDNYKFSKISHLPDNTADKA